MVNNFDCPTQTMRACCKAASLVPEDPVNFDYKLGLPDAPLLTPKNILLFSRKKPFDNRLGDAHRECILLACLQGKGDIIIDGEISHLRPGALLLVTPYQFHHYTPFKEPKLLWLYISFEIDDIGALDHFKRRLILMTPFQQQCLERLTRIYAALKGKRVARPEIAHLVAWLLEGFRGCGRTRKRKAVIKDMSPTRHLIQDVARYVHEHAAKKILIPDVARATKLSPSRLRTVFKAQEGVSLGAYIRRLQLHHARTLVISTDLRLKEIAEQCGFESIYSFSRAFRKQMGHSPLRFRNMARPK